MHSLILALLSGTHCHHTTQSTTQPWQALDHSFTHNTVNSNIAKHSHGKRWITASQLHTQHSQQQTQPRQNSSFFFFLLFVFLIDTWYFHFSYLSLRKTALGVWLVPVIKKMDTSHYSHFNYLPLRNSALGVWLVPGF